MNDTTTSTTNTTTTPGLFEAHPHLREAWEQKHIGFYPNLLNSYYAQRDRSDLDIENFHHQPAEVKDITRAYKDIRGSLDVAIALACHAYDSASKDRNMPPQYETFYGLAKLRKLEADKQLDGLKKGIENLIGEQAILQEGGEHSSAAIKEIGADLNKAFDNIESLMLLLNRHNLRVMLKDHKGLTPEAESEHKLCAHTLMPHIQKQLVSLREQVASLAPEAMQTREGMAVQLIDQAPMRPTNVVLEGAISHTLAAAGPDHGGPSVG